MGPPTMTDDVGQLSRSMAGDIADAPRDHSNPVRRSAEFAGRFLSADRDLQRAWIAARPGPTGDPRWDAFLGALVEWLAVRSRLEVPGWAYEPDRYLDRAWWVTDAESMKAWEYAGAPMSFKLRGVYLHRDSLVNI